MILYIETMNNQKKTKYSYRIYKKYSPFFKRNPLLWSWFFSSDVSSSIFIEYFNLFMIFLQKSINFSEIRFFNFP